MPIYTVDGQILTKDGQIVGCEDDCCDDCVEDYCAQPMHLLMCPPDPDLCFAEDYSGTVFEISCDEEIDLDPSSFTADLYRLYGGNYYLRTVTFSNVRLRWNSFGLRIIADWAWDPAPSSSDPGSSTDQRITRLSHGDLGECPPPYVEGTWTDSVLFKILDPSGDPVEGWSRCDENDSNCVCPEFGEGIYYLGLPGEIPSC